MSKGFIIIGLLLGMLFSQSTNAQVYRQGDGILSVGVGFGYSARIGGVGGLDFGGFGPIMVGYESIVSQSSSGAFGVGGIVGGRFGGLLGTTFTVMARGAYHFNVSREFDVYLGLGLGAHIQSVDMGLLGRETNLSFAYGFFLGGRYYLSDAMAIQAELGYGVSIFNIGLAFKF